MRGLFIRWVVLAAAILLTAYFMDGIVVNGIMPALFAAIVLSTLNTVIRPILLIITLPITVLSMGLFLFIINAFLLMIVSHLITGFQVVGFFTAVFGSLSISIFSWILNIFIGGDDQIAIHKQRYYFEQHEEPQREDQKETDVVDLKNKGDHWE